MAAWQDLDLNQPVNWMHPLNRGRLAWWLAAPGRFGSPSWWDLVGGLPAVFAGTPPGGWDQQHNPGGVGCFNANNRLRATAVWKQTNNGPITIAVWAKPNSLSGSGVLSIGNNASDTSGQYYFQLTSSAWQVHTSHGYLTSSFAPSTTRWDRLVLTYDGSVNSHFYVNGVLQSSFTTSFSLEDNNNIYLGSGSPAGYYGRLNDATVWNRPLTAAEVTADFTLGQQGYPGVLNFQGFDPLPLLLSSGSPPPSFVFKPFVSRPRFEPAFFE